VRRARRWLCAVSVLLGTGALAGCGLNVQSPDLFLLTRTGPGGKLTLEVSDGGAIRCNGGHARTISSARLITARDLADNLSSDAGHNLDLPTAPGSIYTFRILLQQGTIRFSDRDTSGRPNLAQAALFATEAAQQVCGLSS
jgi:hypothetical protein